MIRRALSSLPAKPVLWIAPLVIVLGLAFHYGDTYRICSAHAGLRADLMAAIESRAGGSGSLRLADIVTFPWDRADITVGYRPDGRTADCPFGWDWSEKERFALSERGLLTLIVFSRGGQLVDYIEVAADRADFQNLKNPYTPDTAVFDVQPTTGGGAAVLRPTGVPVRD